MAYNEGPIFENVGRIVYGTGLDGTITLDGTSTVLGIAPVTVGGRKKYFLSRDITPENVTVNSGVDLIPNGYRIYIRNKLTIQSNATVNMDGADANGITGGPGIGNVTVDPALTSFGRGTLHMVAGKGGDGRTANGTNQAGLSATNTPIYTLKAYSGGSGGGVGGGAPGAGGTSTIITVPGAAGTDLTYMFTEPIMAMTGKVFTSNFFPISGGPGGGGGATSAPGGGGISGAGGAGGGCVLICAYELENNGIISANGGRGANATANPAGGGGGGAGGWVSVVFRYMTKQGTITASGGLAGASINATSAATDGASGYVTITRA